MLSNIRKALFVGCHPDDIELGCGPLLARYASHWDIRCVTFSRNALNPHHGDLVAEQRASMEVMGLKPHQVAVQDFVTRRFHESRQEILDALCRFKVDFEPDIVFTHAPEDRHQDHEVLTKEVLRAYRDRSILGYWVAPSQPHLTPNFLFEVSHEDVERTVRALACYVTHRGKRYMDPDAIRAPFIMSGTMIDKRFAVSLESIRFVVNATPGTPPKGP